MIMVERGVRRVVDPAPAGAYGASCRGRPAARRTGENVMKDQLAAAAAALAAAAAVTAPAQAAPADPLLCPVLEAFFPPDGDIVLPDPIGLAWDCPPYHA